MPKVFTPHKWGEHRSAAIALYRALLSQSSKLQFDSAEHGQWLSNTLRNRFRFAKYCISLRRLRVNFEAGYDALDRLDSAVAGDTSAKQGIVELLERVSSRVKEELLPTRPVSKRKMREISNAQGGSSNEGTVVSAASPSSSGQRNHPFKPQPDSITAILQRPLPLDQLSGYRHVPVLFNANMIPVLRLKKPQPKALSGYLNGRIIQRQKRHDLRHRLEDMLVIAQAEDHWDRLVVQMSRQHNARSGEGEGCSTPRDNTQHIYKPLSLPDSQESTWRASASTALTLVQGDLDRERHLARVMTEKFQAVVDRERALFEKERVERRFTRWQERKRLRESAAQEKLLREADCHTASVERSQEERRAEEAFG